MLRAAGSGVEAAGAAVPVRIAHFRLARLVLFSPLRSK